MEKWHAWVACKTKDVDVDVDDDARARQGENRDNRRRVRQTFCHATGALLLTHNRAVGFSIKTQRKTNREQITQIFKNNTGSASVSEKKSALQRTSLSQMDHNSQWRRRSKNGRFLVRRRV